jgi:putative endopeptidase
MKNKSGIDLSHVHSATRVQDDLYRHVNGAWIQSATIPDDRAADGAFYALRDQSEAQVRAIIEELAQGQVKPGSNEQKIGDLYKCFMDEARAEELGISPIEDDLKKAQSIATAQELLATMGEFEYRGNGGMFYTYINTDDHDSASYIAYIGQSGLSLPDEAYYREDEYASIRDALLIHIEKMFDLAEIPDGKNHALRIL